MGLPRFLRPVVPLGAEGSEQGVPKSIVLRRAVARYADDQLLRGRLQPQGAVEPVPEGEDHRVVGVGFRPNLGMMDAVQARGDEDEAERPLQFLGEPEVCVLEEGAGLEDQLVGEELLQAHADEQHLNDPEDRGKRHLHEMEAEAGGNIEVGVEVVDVVEAPEEWDLVVEPVPVIKSQV